RWRRQRSTGTEHPRRRSRRPRSQRSPERISSRAPPRRCRAERSRKGFSSNAEVENQVSRQEAVSSDEVRQGEARQGLRQAPLYLWQDAGLETPQPRHRLLEADGREKAEEGTISLRSELVMRVTRGFKARRRRNRVLKLSKGYRGRRKNCYKRANQA